MNDMIFVFGSNRAGRHGAGAALYAMQHYGAVYGVGEGPTGQAYALPTKGYKVETLPLEEIQEHVVRFLDYAGACPWLTFKVTKVGCGLAGYSEKDIMPMFVGAPNNCLLPFGWHGSCNPW